MKKALMSKRNKTKVCNQLGFQTSEAYKVLRSNLLFSLPDVTDCKIVGITSSIQHEGKSVTACNLAYSISALGKRVLLLDGDMRMPSIAGIMEIDFTPGLSNVLSGMAERKAAVISSALSECFHILPAGDIPPNPSELLGSGQMKQLLEELKTEYDYIIIDLPPVNLVTDTADVSPLVNGIIVVIRRGYTEKQTLQDCMKRINLMPAKFLGYIMNDVTKNEKRRKKKYDGYYYEYR